MSMEIFVLSDTKLSDLSLWQKAIDLEGFPLLLDSERAIEKLSGYLPATWRGDAAGFECDHWPTDDFDNDPIVAAEPKRRYALAFRWSGDFMAAQGAYAAAAAYARATNGVVFDTDAGKLISPQAAVNLAREFEAGLPAMKAMLAEVVTKFSKPK